MPNFFQTLARIERRVRLVRGMHWGSISFAGVAVALTFVMIAGYLGLIDLDVIRIYALAPVPFLAMFFAWIIGRRLPVNVPRVLLHVDLSLSIGERFSSLHELYRRAQAGPYRDLLERKLRELNPDWKRGIPFRKSYVLVPLALCALIAGTTLAVLPPGGEAMHVASSPATVSSGTATRRIGEPDDKPLAVGTDAQQPSPATGTPGNPEHSLEDVLDDLWSSSSSPGVISGDQEELDQLVSSQRAAAKALEQLISEIEKRISEEERSELTPEERQALSQLAEQMGNTPIGQALRDLSQAETPEDLEEQLEGMRQLARSMDNPYEDDPGEMANDTLPSSEQGEEGQQMTWAPPASSPGDEVDEDGQQNEDGAAQPSEGDSGSSERRAVQPDEDSYGGNQGAGDGSSRSTSVLPQFVRQELAGIIGASGDFQDFATKGVPLEQVPAISGDELIPAVNYDALRALLDARTLPPGAADVVRAYFDDITQGEK